VTGDLADPRESAQERAEINADLEWLHKNLPKLQETVAGLEAKFGRIPRFLPTEPDPACIQHYQAGRLSWVFALQTAEAGLNSSDPSDHRARRNDCVAWIIDALARALGSEVALWQRQQSHAAAAKRSKPRQERDAQLKEKLGQLFQEFVRKGDKKQHVARAEILRAAVEIPGLEEVTRKDVNRVFTYPSRHSLKK
jgi:hypothetical protein